MSKDPTDESTDTPLTRETMLLLGEDHPGFGDLTLAAQAGGRTAGAISVGSDAADGVRAFKGDLDVPNEDACLAVDEGAWTLLAVADAHFGHESSHALLRGLAAVAIPGDPLALFEAILDLVQPGPPPHSPALRRSETTLAAAVVDRGTGRGFGVSYGDSTMVVLGADRVRALHRKSAVYVDPWHRGTLNPARAHEMAFRLHPGEVLLGFTDGVNECHYNKPRTSVRPRNLWDLYRSHGAQPKALAQAIGELALAGVDGNPGGQDNLALVLTAGHP